MWIPDPKGPLARAEVIGEMSGVVDAHGVDHVAGGIVDLHDGLVALHPALDQNGPEHFGHTSPNRSTRVSWKDSRPVPLRVLSPVPSRPDPEPSPDCRRVSRNRS